MRVPSGLWPQLWLPIRDEFHLSFIGEMSSCSQSAENQWWWDGSPHWDSHSTTTQRKPQKREQGIIRREVHHAYIIRTWRSHCLPEPTAAMVTCKDFPRMRVYQCFITGWRGATRSHFSQVRSSVISDVRDDITVRDKPSCLSANSSPLLRQAALINVVSYVQRWPERKRRLTEKTGF